MSNTADSAEKRVKMLAITDQHGRVVAAAHVGAPRDDGLTVGVQALPGQRVREIEVPAAIAELEQGHHLQAFLAAAQNAPDGGLILPEIEAVQASHERTN